MNNAQKSISNFIDKKMQVKQETKPSIKAQISFYKSQMEKEEKKNSILHKEERENR
ncbi:MAG: hypothetical protein ACI4DN_09225 [Lachnospiraceae bacterium]